MNALNVIHNLWLLYHVFACLLRSYLLASIELHCQWLHFCVLYMFVLSSSRRSTDNAPTPDPLKKFGGRSQLLTQQREWCLFAFKKLCGGRRGRLFLPLLFPSDIGSFKILRIFLIYCSLPNTTTPSILPLAWFSQPYASQFRVALIPSNNPAKPSTFPVDATKLHVELFLVCFLFCQSPNIVSLPGTNYALIQ